MSTQLTEALRNVPGGPMSSSELSYCDAMRKLFQSALDQKTPFLAVILNLRADFRRLRQFEYDLDSAFAAGAKPAITHLDAFASTNHGTPLTAAQQSLLKDMDGFTDFAVRNGIGFYSVLTVIGHDVNTLSAEYGGDLHRATEDGFRPKSTGWAERNAEPVGESEEPQG